MPLSDATEYDTLDTGQVGGEREMLASRRMDDVSANAIIQEEQIQTK